MTEQFLSQQAKACVGIEADRESELEQVIQEMMMEVDRREREAVNEGRKEAAEELCREWFRCG